MVYPSESPFETQKLRDFIDYYTPPGDLLHSRTND
jgi:hypothetical protein